MNGPEFRIDNFRLDGYAELKDGKVKGFEFHGCLFHGCPKCFLHDTYNPIRQEPMRQTYARHLKRIEYLKSKIEINEIWECEWDQKVKESDNLQKFIKSQPIRDPLTARGRDNAAKIYH